MKSRLILFNAAVDTVVNHISASRYARQARARGTVPVISREDAPQKGGGLEITIAKAPEADHNT